MAELVSYEVARDHFGDNHVADDAGNVSIVPAQFRVGDTRVAPKDVVQSIVGTVLVDPDAPPEARKTKVVKGGRTKVEG